MKRRIIATLLLFSLIFGLCACGRESGDQEADLSSNDLVAGWQPAQIKLPDVLGQVEYITLCKDLIYIAGRASNGPTIGYFDTKNEKWYTLDFDHGGLSSDAHILSCSAANGAVWMLIEDFVPDITGRKYCILYWNSLENASAICMPVGFEAAETRGDAQGTYRFFSGCVALDDQKAILYDTETCYVIDPTVSVLASFPLEENDFSSYQRIDGKLLISGHGSGESFCRFFDQETLQFGERIDFDFHSGRYESENGSLFFTQDNTTYMATAKSKITSAFGSAHILSHKEYLQNAVTNGRPSGGGWFDSTIELMSEQMVYGGKIFAPVSDGSTVPNLYTVAYKQLNLFRFRPDLISNRQTFWLRDVVSATVFAYVNGDGRADSLGAAGSRGVRPVFSIAA